VKLIRNLVVVGVLFATGAFAANLLTNGSFESGTYSNNSNPYGNGYGENLNVGSSSLTGWSIVTDSVSWLYTGDFSLTPENGSYFLDLTGYTDTTPLGGVSQTVYLTAGSYTLTFWVAYSGTGSAGGPVSVVATASENSTTLDSQTFTTSSGSGTNVWTEETLSFTVTTSGNVTISLVGGSAKQYIGLDNVDLEQTGGGSVPEPAMSLPLALAGAFFVLSRRKRARQ
jgi:hypothetical protein